MCHCRASTTSCWDNSMCPRLCLWVRFESLFSLSVPQCSRMFSRRQSHIPCPSAQHCGSLYRSVHPWRASSPSGGQPVYPALPVYPQCTRNAGCHRTVANRTGRQYMRKHLILRAFSLIGELARTRKNRAGKARGASQGRNRTLAYPTENQSFFVWRLSSVPTSGPGAFFADGRVRLSAATPKSCACPRAIRKRSSAPCAVR